MLIKLVNTDDIEINGEVINYLSPKYIYIPILKKTTFKMDDFIYKNTYFGDYNTSVSGIVSGSKKIFFHGKYYPALKITNDYKEEVDVKRKNTSIKNKDELIKALEKFHLNNIIDKINNVKNIKNVILSSIDEEVYSLNEYMLLSNNTASILEAYDYILKILKIKKGIMTIKNTFAKSIKNVKSILGTYPNISIKLIPDKYLISYKTYLTKYLNLKKDETVILTTNDLNNIYTALIKGKDIEEVLITISGNAILKSVVINTKIGVSLEELINKFVEIKESDYDVYINGYLKGKRIDNYKEIIITKDIECIVINKKVKEEECIKCGACTKICPVLINVYERYKHNLKHNRCIGCGLCNYVCPANINLKEKVMSDDNEKKEY